MKNLFVILLSVVAINACVNSSEKNVSENDSLQKNEKETTVIADEDRIDYSSTTYLKVGDLAPNFELSTVDNKLFSTKTLKGKTIVINFFGLSCPICMEELPFFEKKIWQKYKESENVEIITIGREQTIEELINFRNKKGFTFPIAADVDRAVYAKFAEKMIPRNIVINGKGEIIYHKIGYNEAEFKNLLSIIAEEANK